MSINIDETNLKLLDSLKGNEALGVDVEGRLFVKSADAKATAVVREIIHGEKFVNAQKVAEKFLVNKFTELQKDPTLGKPKFLQWLQLLSQNHLLTKEQKQSVLFAWYEQRRSTLKTVYDDATAMATVTTEMAYDPNFPEVMRKKWLPEKTQGGLSGSYFLKDLEGNIVGVFKPMFQEYGMPLNPGEYRREYNAKKPKITQREGHVQGTSWINEIAAAQISNKFISVPKTTEITLLFQIPEDIAEETDTSLLLQKGSFQKFVPGKKMTELDDKGKKAIPAEEIQKIALFDMLTLNGDRHFGNFLFDGKKIIPIDHGLCFLQYPEVRGEWFVMPQLKEDIKPEVVDWFTAFDAEESSKKLDEMGIDKRSILLHKSMYLFLVDRLIRGENLFEVAQKCVYNQNTQEQTPLQKVILPLLEKYGNNEELYLEQLEKALAEL